MQIKKGETSLVIIGAWNPSILRPDWLAREVFHFPEGSQAPVTMEFAMVPGAPPKFTMGDISFVPMKDRLMLYPKETTQTALADMEAKALEILAQLPHTPVLAFGENFGFIDESPARDQLRVFEVEDLLVQKCTLPFERTTTSITSSLKLGNCTLNLTQSLSGSVLSVKFNFHYENGGGTGGKLGVASDAVLKLTGTFASNLEIVKQFLSSYDGIPPELMEA
jgi:hypothetical protein